jgi:hypothetical protein
MSVWYWFLLLVGGAFTLAWILAMFGPAVPLDKIRAEAQARKQQ